MISLNLLSPAQKEYLRYEQIYLTLRTVITLTLTFTVIVSGLFLAARLLLQDNYADLLVSTTTVNDRNRPIDREIAQLNGDLQRVERIQADFVKWSNVIVAVSKAIPENVEVSYLNFELGSHTFNLNGIARKREDFLKLQENLKKLPQLEELSSPASNLLLRENVSFQLAAKLKLDSLR